ncbi:hypothetical protein ABW19_dt0207269 [Dactylella cylindrospora]|nr:hypothetical protein ABW19_dt0207269 [Dactylella cylindrospora]
MICVHILGIFANVSSFTKETPNFAAALVAIPSKNSPGSVSRPDLPLAATRHKRLPTTPGLKTNKSKLQYCIHESRSRRARNSQTRIIEGHKQPSRLKVGHSHHGHLHDLAKVG